MDEIEKELLSKNKIFHKTVIVQIGLTYYASFKTIYKKKNKKTFIKKR